MLDIEAKWEALVELGDPLVAYELAKTWKCSELDEADTKARFWFNRYQALAPSLPFGDYSSLSEHIIESSDSIQSLGFPAAY